MCFTRRTLALALSHSRLLAFIFFFRFGCEKQKLHHNTVCLFFFSFCLFVSFSLVPNKNRTFAFSSSSFLSDSIGLFIFFLSCIFITLFHLISTVCIRVCVFFLCVIDDSYLHVVWVCFFLPSIYLSSLPHTVTHKYAHQYHCKLIENYQHAYLSHSFAFFHSCSHENKHFNHFSRLNIHLNNWIWQRCPLIFVYILLCLRIDTNVTLTSMTVCLLFDSINLASWFIRSRLLLSLCMKGTTRDVLKMMKQLCSISYCYRYRWWWHIHSWNAYVYTCERVFYCLHCLCWQKTESDRKEREQCSQQCFHCISFSDQLWM